MRPTTNLQTELRPTIALGGWSNITHAIWLAGAILKIDMTSYITPPYRFTDLGEIWYADAKCRAHDDKQSQIETGSRILIWRTFVFRNRKQ